MKDKLNAYFAVFFILVAGVAAALFIIRLVSKDSLEKDFVGSEASSYDQLKQSILNNRL